MSYLSLADARSGLAGAPLSPTIGTDNGGGGGGGGGAAAPPSAPSTASPGGTLPGALPASAADLPGRGRVAFTVPGGAAALRRAYASRRVVRLPGPSTKPPEKGDGTGRAWLSALLLALSALA